MGLKQAQPRLNRGFCSHPQAPRQSAGSRSHFASPLVHESQPSCALQGDAAPLGSGPVSGKQLSALQCPLPLSPASQGSSQRPSSPREHRSCLENHQRDPAPQSSTPYCRRHPLPLEGRPRPAAASLYPDTGHCPHSSLPPMTVAPASDPDPDPSAAFAVSSPRLGPGEASRGRDAGNALCKTPLHTSRTPSPVSMQPEFGQGLSP